jgi:DNA polymerase phi
MHNSPPHRSSSQNPCPSFSSLCVLRVNPKLGSDFPKPCRIESLDNSLVKPMGGKKRPSSSMEETTNCPTEKATDSTTSSSKVSEKLRQMEKRKARKALDKERRRLASEGKQHPESKPESKTEEQTTESESKPVKKESKEAGTIVASTSLAQPGLHLDLFRGLSSQESSVREEAAERLVKELRNVQRSYEDSNGNNEEVAESVKMEAKKDDGMDNCAPSLRYAIRRFIRGVSSSREVSRICLILLFCQQISNYLS